MSTAQAAADVVIAGPATPARRSAVMRNAAALMFSTVASSALGMLFWLVGVRIYDAADVGRASAGASAITLLAGFAQLSLNSVFVRFLPTAGSRTSKIIRYSYAAATATAIIVAVAFYLLGLGRGFLPPGPIALLLFCAAVVATAISALQDSVLTALHRAPWVPVENIGIALGKLALLPIFAATAVATPMLLAWGMPIAAAVVTLTITVFAYLAPAHARATRRRQSLPAPSELASFMSAEYLKGILGNVTLYLPPVLVTVVLGPEQNAFFYLPWLIGSAALALSWNISVSFVVEASADPARTRAHVRHTVRLLTLVTVGGGAVLTAGAPLILSMLGKGYAASGDTVLRLIGLSLPFELVTALFTATAIMAKRTWVIFWAQLVTTAAFLGLGYAGLLRFGVVGMAGAYLISHGVIGLALAPATFRRLRALIRAGEQSPGADPTGADPTGADATQTAILSRDEITARLSGPRASRPARARGAAPVRARGVAAVPHIQPGFTTGPVQVIFLPVSADWERVGSAQTVLMPTIADHQKPSAPLDADRAGGGPDRDQGRRG